jgi:hypothetical protein
MLDGDDASLDTAAEAFTKINIKGLWEAEGEERNDVPAEPGQFDDDDQETPKEGDDQEVEASETDDDAKEGGDKAASGDVIEIPDPNGGEPTRIAVDEAVEAYKNWTALGGNVAAVVQRAEERVLDVARERVQAYNTALTQGITTMQSWIAALPMPQEPSTELLNPSSPNYDPDKYHLGVYQFRQAVGLIQNAQGQLQQMMQQKARNDSDMQERVAEAEWKRLVQADPEWGRDPEGKRSKLLSGLSEHYGVSEKELEEIYNHKLYRIAEDAIAFRAMKASAPTLKKQVQEKAAKVTQTRRMPQSVIDQKRQGEAQKQLKKSGSVNAAADALLARLDKFL